jgi:KaiC/GvpD/RAD55 family RecA-like ATPase
MRMMFNGEDLAKVLKEKIGDGKCILLRYGPGSGGEFLIKQFYGEREEGSYSVFISTYEDKDEVDKALQDAGLPTDGEVISVMDLMKEEIDMILKKDRFTKEGILVTDLLDLSSREEEVDKEMILSQEVLSMISTTASKQVMPFRMAIDTLSDLVMISGEDEVWRRFLILRGVLRKYGGMVMVGLPEEDMVEFPISTIFDAILDIRAERTDEGWTRSMTVSHIRNSLVIPEDLEISEVNELPRAKSLE